MSEGLQESQDEANESTHFLLFKMGEELYGTPLHQIREVIKTPQIKFLPANPKFLKGVINLRGRVVTVLDLKAKLGIMSLAENTLVLVIDSGQNRLGILIDSAESVVQFKEFDIDRPQSLLVNSMEGLFIGIAKTTQGMVNLVNLDVLLKEVVSNLAHD